MEKIDERNRQRADFEREESLVRQAFLSRYKDRIEPGVGCDICPDICSLTDLRAMDVDEFKHAYRQMVSDQFEHRDHLARDLAPYERERLLCIARREPAMRDALQQVFVNAHERPMVRCFAARDFAHHGFGNSEPRRVLDELARGKGHTAMTARMIIHGWDTLGWPGE